MAGTPIRDQTADPNGVELNRLRKQYDFPSFVKQANWDQLLDPGQLPDSAYADPRTHQFPCDTAAHTWVSALYFQEKRAEYHPKDATRIAERLDMSASYHRIVPAVEAMRVRWSELHKTAEAQLPDSVYASIMVYEDGHKERHCPLTSAREVKRAASWLNEYRDEHPFTARQQIATRILEKAAEFGAALGAHREFLEKQAGKGIGDPAAIVAMLKARASMLPTADERAVFAKMASIISDVPATRWTPDLLSTLVETVEQADRRSGLFGHYSTLLPRPEDVVFGATFSKVAEALNEHVPTTTGRAYEKAAFKRVSLDDVTSLFGPEFAAQVSNGLSVDPEKMAEVCSTLPRPDAMLLDGLMSDLGIHPVKIKAAAARQRFTEEQWAAFAKTYLPERAASL